MGDKRVGERDGGMEGQMVRGEKIGARDEERDGGDEKREWGLRSRLREEENRYVRFMEVEREVEIRAESGSRGVVKSDGEDINLAKHKRTQIDLVYFRTKRRPPEIQLKDTKTKEIQQRVQKEDSGARTVCCWVHGGDQGTKGEKLEFG